MLYVRFPLSLRNVEDLLHERGIIVSHESVRFWWNRFEPLFAGEIRRKRVSRMRAHSNWQWHLDEMFVRINGETHYLWRAVDHEGEVLESFVTKRRDRKAAMRFLRKSMKRFGQPQTIVTDRLRSYSAAMNTSGNAEKQETGRWLNNRAENSHRPFRRRERARLRFRQMRSRQKLPPSILQSIIISIKSAISTQAITSNSTAPLLWPSGANFVQHRFRSSVAKRDWFELVWQHSSAPIPR